MKTIGVALSLVLSLAASALAAGDEFTADKSSRHLSLSQSRQRVAWPAPRVDQPCAGYRVRTQF
jgi:hypothetical protein